MRGLARGLKVLQIMQAQAQALSLHDLFLASGFSKPSLLRILSTLERHNMIYRGIDDGRYRRSTPSDSTPSPCTQEERLTAAAGPVLDRLCARVKWPIDLVVRSGDHMELRESTRVLSPFHMGRMPIGFCINMPFSGAGRAYIAFAPEAERTEILGQLKASRDESVRDFVASGRMHGVLQATSRRGYGERDAALARTIARDSAGNDGTCGISVPLRGRERVYGCINLIWLLRACSTAAIAAQHLQDLQGAASEIVAAVEHRH